MKKTKTAYDKLHEISKNAALFSSVQSLLEWDQETYMPHDGMALRPSQLEQMASLVHKQRTSPAFTKALSKLIDIETAQVLDDSLSLAQKAALREWRRDYNNTVKLPNSFVKTFAKTTSAAQHAWSEAKRSSDFAKFAPHLQKIVDLCRKKTEILGYKEHPYDALLDLYEPEMTSAILTPLFARLKTSLTSILQAITAKPAKSYDFLSKHYPADKQMQFGKFLLDALGFKETSSRLDITSHPFCMGLHPSDTRLTTRIYLDNPLSNIFSVIHEAGHGIYDKGLPPEQWGSPLGEAISLGIHESQSRWWETRIGRSLPFWQYFFPHLQKMFPDVLKNVTAQDFYRSVNQVHPSFIRVEADEVTYSLHVILRFELEKALIEGSLQVKDIPEAWNAKMQSYLGITPASDAEGCLQDIHWSMGGLGYFPTYTLGNLYAAQFFQSFEKDQPQWKEKVAKGELGFIRDWLKEHIHKYGRQYTPSELVMRIAKQPLTEKPFIEYLEKKYKDIYNY